ncbi:HAMP domain-containing sensor histidine kinase [Spirosoma humi]
MRLLTRSTLISALVFFMALIGSGFYVFDQVSQEVHDEIDEELQNRKLEILASIAAHPNALIVQPGIATDFQLDTISAATYSALHEHTEDIPMYERVEEEYEPHRQLVTKFIHKGIYYRLRIHMSLLDLEDMGEVIALSTGAVIASLLVLSFLLNFFLQQRLWRPFYSTLSQLRTFKIDQADSLTLPVSSVHEFTELNKTITWLTTVNQRAYQHQKQFVENASHELQTPLAIALHQTEQLIQSPALTTTDAQALELLNQQLERLSALNRALLLLSKIDNQQFGETQSVNLGALIRQTVEEYEFMAEHKGLRVQLLLLDDFDVSANHHLIVVLLRNLIRNALVHTPTDGTITIRLANQSLQIENTAAASIDRPETLFDRFVKQSDQSQSLGLGLAIVKSICDTYGFTPHITQQKNLFILSIQF